MAFDARGVPIKRGKAKYLTIDLDALEGLEELAVGPGAQGRVVSELIRAEVCRREERARRRQEVQQARERICETVEEVLTP